jgi:ribosomal 30S subunit maturation factor RimM
MGTDDGEKTGSAALYHAHRMRYFRWGRILTVFGIIGWLVIGSSEDLRMRLRFNRGLQEDDDMITVSVRSTLA